MTLPPPKKNWPFSHMKHLRFSSIDNQRKRKERKERVGKDKCRKEGTEKKEGREEELKIDRIQKFRKDQSTKKKTI